MTDVSDTFDREFIGGDWRFPGGQLIITSGTLRVTFAQGPAEWVADTFDDDHFSEVTYEGTNPNGTGPAVRCAHLDPTNGLATCYYLYGSGDGWQLWRYTGSGFESIGSKVTMSTPAGVPVRLTANGSTLTAHVDGVEIISETDANIAAGRPAVWLDVAATSWPTSWLGGDGVEADASDNFNRADVGDDWNLPSISPQLLDGAIRATLSAGIAYWGANDFEADHHAEVAYAGANPASGGPAVRVDTQGRGYYLFGNGAGWQLWRYDGGASFTALSSQVNMSTGAGQTVRLEAEGDALTAYVNGAEIISETDATYAAGAPGVWLDADEVGPTSWLGGPIEDEVAPVLSGATGDATGTSTASLSVTTDEGNGTLMWVVTSSSTAPSGAQVAAGQDHTGAAAADSGSQAVVATGAQNVAGGASGLLPATTYWAHFVQDDAAANRSAVATSGSFTTDEEGVEPEPELAPGAWRPSFVAFLLGDAALSAAVGGSRVFPVVLPQEETRRSIVYAMTGDRGDHHTEGPSGLARPRMRVDAIADDIDDAAALAGLVKARLDGYAGPMVVEGSPPEGVTVQGVFFDSSRDDYRSESKLYVVSAEFLCWIEER